MRSSIILIFILFIISNYTYSQEVEMADQFREDGKIYVVLAVIFILLAGLFIFLFSLDKRAKKIEKKLKDLG